MRQVRFGERLRRPCKDKMAGTGAYSGGFAGERAHKYLICTGLYFGLILAFPIITLSNYHIELPFPTS
jgi:hypothetical protein